MDLRAAVTSHPALESLVFSHLLFNIPLWLSPFSPPPSPHPLPGVALHAALLPILSALCQQEPKKVHDSVTTERLMSYFEMSLILPTVQTPEPLQPPFTRSAAVKLPPQSPPTSHEKVRLNEE